MADLPEQQARQNIDAMLRGEELPEDADEQSSYEVRSADVRPKNVAYNPSIPIETFDFIVTDECRRSIYGLLRQVLEYFDAYLSVHATHLLRQTMTKQIRIACFSPSLTGTSL